MMRWIAISLLCATSAVAEGATRTIACAITTTCDQNGVCAAETQDVTFVMEPTDVGRHGEGTYTLSYNFIQVEMLIVGWFGPYMWTEGQDDLQTLLVSGENEMLWHRFNTSDPPTSVTRFLICEEAQ